jgi:ABC-type polysaccharide transport system, permease component
MLKTKCTGVQIIKTSKVSSKDNLQLSLFALPAIIQIFIFSYLPMFGIILAFKNFNVVKGILRSDWVGLDNFTFFFTSLDAARILRNTLLLNLLFIFVGTVISIIFALILFEINSRIVIKTLQTVFVSPALISWVIVGYITFILLDPGIGVINNIINTFGGKPVSWYTEPQYWPLILLLCTLWKGTGLSCLYYYTALMGIDIEIFDATKLDGANRIQTIIHVSIPYLVPTIIILTILQIGGILRSDFGLFYNITRDIGALYPTTDVIDTYIYRALSSLGNIGMSSAVGLFQSAVGFVLILATNTVVRRISKENSLF